MPPLSSGASEGQGEVLRSAMDGYAGCATTLEAGMSVEFSTDLTSIRVIATDAAIGDVKASPDYLPEVGRIPECLLGGVIRPVYAPHIPVTGRALPRVQTYPD